MHRLVNSQVYLFSPVSFSGVFISCISVGIHKDREKKRTSLEEAFHLTAPKQVPTEQPHKASTFRGRLVNEINKSTIDGLKEAGSLTKKGVSRTKYHYNSVIIGRYSRDSRLLSN